MNIAVDLDGCLAETVEQVIIFHNDVYKTSLKKSDFTSSFYEKIWGGTKEESELKVEQFVNSSYFSQIKVVESALQELIRIKSLGHTLFLVTGRNQNLRQLSLDWINLFFPNIFEGVYFTNAYSVNNDSISKAIICLQLHCSFIIEDDMMHIKECAKSNIKVLVLDQPWNSGKLPVSSYRVLNWQEITSAIAQF